MKLTSLTALKAIKEIAESPINKYETEALRLEMINRLCTAVLQDETEELCPHCGEPYSRAIRQPNYHDRCHLIGRK